MFSKIFSRSRRTVRRQQTRRVFFEPLEDRRLLASDCVIPEWYNTNLDEGDNVTPIDVLVILNHMYDNGGADPSYSQTETPGRFLDVNFDGKVTPVDSNIVIEYLETNGPGPFVLECPDEEVGTLTVVQKSLATTDVVVANENNVVLLAFEASADDIGDIFVTSARFTASVGDTVNAEGLDLWADTDNNGTGDTIVAEAPDGNFDNIFGGGYVIPAGETVRFEVHGDMASSFSGNQFQLAFADNPITAEALDDGSELEGINVITTDSTLFTLQSSGTLTVTEDSTPVRSHQLLGGTLSEAVLRLSLSADAEDVDVTYIGVDILGPDRSIDRLEAFLPGATTPFAVGTKAGAITGDNYGFRMPNRELVVGKGSNQDVIIKVRVNADTNGGVRGDTFAADVDAVFAQGGISSNDIAADIAADIVGPYHTVVMSKISSIVNVNPDANGTAVPTGPSNVGQFKFAAAANTNTQNGLNKVVVDQLTFTVNAVNVAMDAGAFRFINKADATVSSSTYRLERLDGTATAASGTITGSFRVIFTGLDASLVDTEISQGEDKTFVLQVNVTNPNTSTQVSSLQVSLQLDDPGFIRWLDRDNGGSTQFSWIEYPDTTVKSTSYQS